jgi:type IV pilus assembly protein PilY1
MAIVQKMRRVISLGVLPVGLLAGISGLSHAAVTDLASSPLSSTSASVVRPNVLFTLDDSGSMDWSYLPDYAGGTTYSGGSSSHCKVSNSCGTGETPYQTNEYNGMAYNPRISYQLPVNADGTFKASQGSPWTAVKVDGFGVQSTSTINLTTGYPEVVYCNSGVCKKNGVDTNNPFFLRPSVSADNPPVYAFPGSLTSGTTVVSTVHDGAMNQATQTSGTIYNGTLNISTDAVSTTLTGVSVSHSNSTVTVAYNAISPALVTGDSVVVSGSTCSSGYRSGGNSRTITVTDATHFTYTSNSGSGWSNTSCTIVATKAAVVASPPSITKSGNTVTVTLTSAPTPALATGNPVTVTNGAGTCDPGYRATSVPMTRISSTSFSYPVATALGTASNSSCNITQIGSTPPSSPGINLSGTTVTVYKTSHGLVTGDLIQVSNGTSGTCDNGYRTSSTVTVTRVDSNTFTYSPTIGSDTANSNCKIEKMLPGTTVSYTSASTVNGSPYYFVIIPTEYCDSLYLTNCVAATAPVTVSGIAYTYPAPVRFCKDTTTAELAPGDAGAQTSTSGSINCQAKYSVGTGINFQAVRYGLFWRGNIVSTRTSYGNESYTGTVSMGSVSLAYNNTLVVDRSQRTDCAAPPNCTYAEEMTNFANWYAYYHTRMQMMKSSAGRAFSTLDNRYRVGFVTINESSSKYLPVAKFDTTQKTNWYAKFYAVNPGNSTPLREAMADAGRYFAGKKPGIFTDDPVEYACQQNFELITTDGYWNGTDSNVKELDGATTMRNYDNVDSGTSKRGDGAYDGGVSGASNTLADVAMYYYKTDLRNSSLSNCTGALGTDVCQDIVPMTSKDTLAGLAGTQHMTTFSLGLADGLMTYQSDYETAVTGDVSKIKTGAQGCSFSGSGTCNWPLPVHDSQTALDDLWHAAINGRGTYYNARDPASLATGLSNALSGINVRLAAAAASATSSPNITQTDRSIFSSTYRTTKWDGEVTAQLINATTGNVEPAIIWSAQTQLDTLVHADSSSSKSSRHIYTFDDANALGNHLKDFLYGSLTSTEQAYFNNKCTYTLLTQCTAATLSSSEITSGNSGLNLLHYLRGNQSLESDGVFRARDHLLGDTVNAKPAYVKVPQFNFVDAVTPGYSAFKVAQAARQGVLYMGSNDGMLHAFNADTGAEMWAYVPKIVMPTLYKLAEVGYSTLHQYYVDGSPETMDIYVDTTGASASGLTVGWHTILVGGLGLGGRGYYALEVTDPANPHALWEICSDSALCAISEADIGYTYGNPVITKRSSDGKWVVLLTSGYNNVSPGSGIGTLFVVDAVTGSVLDTATTGTATNPPNGLAKISPLIDSLNTDNTTRFVYGGDLNGNVWRFDLGVAGSTAAPTVTKIASLKDSSGVAQSVTTRPELGDPLANLSNSLSGSGNVGVFVATGRYLGTTDLSNVQVQSVYGMKDDLSKTGTAAYIGNPRSPQTGFGNFVKQYIYQPTATTRTTSKNSVSWSTNSGWYADFVVSDSATNLPVSPSVSPGERVNLDPLLVSSTLIVITNVPETSACTLGGTSWLYSFDFLSGQNVATAADQVVGQKIGNALAVGVVVGRLPAGQLKAWVTTAGGEKSTLDPATKGSGATRRTSWRELVQ